jgi:hypothetical protein
MSFYLSPNIHITNNDYIFDMDINSMYPYQMSNPCKEIKLSEPEVCAISIPTEHFDEELFTL